MSADFFILQRDYTVCNALVWGNCAEHYRLASTTPAWSSRIGHGTIALLEAIPVICQIVSLFELVIASTCRYHPVMRELGEREIHRIDPIVVQLPHLERTIDAVEEAEEVTVVFPLHRQLEQLYADLPWPAQKKEMMIFTKVNGGRGDVAAAAKTI